MKYLDDYRKAIRLMDAKAKSKAVRVALKPE